MNHLYAPWRAEYLMSGTDAIDGCLFCVLPAENDDRKNMILERCDNWYVIVNKYPYTTGRAQDYIKCAPDREDVAEHAGTCPL